MKIRAVFLDVGGVVLKIDWTRPLEVLGVPHAQRGAIVEKLKAWPVFHRFEEGTAEPDEFFSGINRLLGLTASREKLEEAWLSLIVGDLPGNEMLFAWLEQNQVPVYALSNTNLVHDQFQMKQFPILTKFKYFFKSYKMGMRKPGREIYLKAAEVAGFKPSECLFIDDTLENIEGALRANWHAFHTVDNVAATLEIFKKEI